MPFPSRKAAITGDTTLAFGGENKKFEVNSSSDITITVPFATFSDYPDGAIYEFVRIGTGNVAFAAASGTTINSPGGALRISARYGSVLLRHSAALSNTWYLTGDLETPNVRAYHNASQTLTNNAWTTIALNSERWDLGTPSLNMHDTSTNNSRLTCRVPGLYVISGHGIIGSAAGGTNRLIRVLLNGTTSIGEGPTSGMNFVATPEPRIAITTQYRLAVNDYVELQAFQDSGAGLNLNTVANTSPEFMACWITA